MILNGPIITPKTEQSAPTMTKCATAAMDYMRNNHSEDGLTGGDGTYSIPTGQGKTAWIFGDSFIGGVNGNGTRSHDQKTFIRNSFVLQNGEDMRLITGKPQAHL